MPKAAAHNKTQERVRNRTIATVEQKKREAAKDNTPATRPPEPAKQTDLSPRFKWVLIIVTCLTGVSGIVYLALCIIFPQVDLTSRIQDAVETMKTAFFGGFGAIIGLLGGKLL